MSSTETHTTVAIAAVTGKLGRLIAGHLLSHPKVHVHGIARNPDKLPEEIRANPKFQAFKSDMTDATALRPAVRGCSILISVLLSDPATEMATQKAMIDACVAEEVPRFMPNDFTLEWRTADLELLPQKKVNQELLRYLEERENKIKHVHVLNGGFIETLFSAGYWFPPDRSPAKGLHYWGTGNEKWELASYDQTARCTAAVALDAGAAGFLKVLGDHLSLKEIAQTLQRVYNIPEIPLECRGSLTDIENTVRKGLEQDPNSDDFWLWKAQSYILFLTNGQGYLGEPLDNSRYQDTVKPETLETWLRNRELEDLSKAAWF